MQIRRLGQHLEDHYRRPGGSDRHPALFVLASAIVVALAMTLVVSTSGAQQAGHDDPAPDVIESCLDGSGRVDVVVMNTGSAVAKYRVEYPGVASRTANVKPFEEETFRFDGRPDGTAAIGVSRNGVQTSALAHVRCTSSPPTVDDQEVRVVASCKSGLGRISAFVVNRTAVRTGWILDVEGEPERTAYAQAYELARPRVNKLADGTYRYQVTSTDAAGDVRAQGVVQSSCKSATTTSITTVDFGTPGCSQNPAQARATLQFTIDNRSAEAKTYDLRVGPHGHNGLVVAAGQHIDFTLQGIPYGVHDASVLLDGATIARRSGLGFNECSQFESRILSIRFAPGAGDYVEYTGDVATPVDDIERSDLMGQIDTAENVIIDTLLIGSSGQLDVRRDRVLQYEERPPQSDRRAFGPTTSPRPDYPAILNSTIAGDVGDFCSYLEAQEIDMIWMWTNHLSPGAPVDQDALIEPTESAMSFPGNSEPHLWPNRLNIANHGNDPAWLPGCAHTYIVYNFNYTRVDDPSAHIIMHQVEGYLGYNGGGRTYLDDNRLQAGRKQIDKKLFDWLGSPAPSEAETTIHYAFTGWDHADGSHRHEHVSPHNIYVNKGSWSVECGDSHWAPNVERHPGHGGNVVEYNYALPDVVSSSCTSWNPQGTGTRTNLSCVTWDGCGDRVESVRNYERWWFQQLPGTNIANPIFYDHIDGKRYPIRNFWEVFSDFDSVAGDPTTDGTFTSTLSYMVDFSQPQ